MILLTVGTTERRFERMGEVFEIVRIKYPREKIIYQYGANTKPINLKSRVVAAESFNYEEMNKYIKTARIVITHGGMTVLQALMMGKDPIVFPRQRKYGEHVNDHQLVFCKSISKRKWIRMILKPSEITMALEQKRSAAEIKTRHQHVTGMVKWLDNFTKQ